MNKHRFNIQDRSITELLNRFFSKVIIPDNLEKCWVWIGTTTRYGQLSFLGSFSKSHRLSYWIFIEFCHSNLINEPKRIIRHTCNKPLCVNPTHLVDGTQKDNMNDRSIRTTHCKRDHEYTESNTYIDKNGWKSCITCRYLNYTRHNNNKKTF